MYLAPAENSIISVLTSFLAFNMNCFVIGQPGLQGFRGESGPPGAKGGFHTTHLLNSVKFIVKLFIFWYIITSFSYSAGDRGLAGFQGLKGLLYILSGL